MLLGQPLMAWQRHVLAVAMEIDPATGRLAYPQVGVSVARQNGKSVLLEAGCLLRATAPGAAAVGWACQARQAARVRLFTLADTIPAHWVAALSRTNGAEQLTFGFTGATWRIVTAGPRAGRGLSIDHLVIDEAALLGFDTYAALSPTQTARPDAQMWVASNAGDETSLLWRSWHERGRAAAAADTGHGLAWFEWSAPDELAVADYADPAIWAQAIPALGTTITPAALEARLDEPGFAREYLNVWPVVASTQVIPAAVWAGAVTHRRPDAGWALAVEVHPDRSFATIAAAGPDPSDPARTLVWVEDRRPGTGWVAGTVARLVAAGDVVAVVVDRAGPAGSLLEDLAEADVEVQAAGAAELVAACAGFYDALIDGRVAHGAQHILDVAAGAGKVTLGDRWRWERTRGDLDLTPLTAVSLARWALRVWQTTGKPPQIY